MAKRLREALEAALRENPDDLAAHMAWADHAAEQGDPRGEFAQVQIALEDPSRPAAERKALEARETELLVRHRDEWLGGMEVLFDRIGYAEYVLGIESFRYDRNRYTFTRGWLDTLHLDQLTPEVVEAIAACPSALLRELGINGDEYENPGLDRLPGLPSLGTLRAFRLGVEDGPCRVEGHGVAPALRKMPRLEDLRLYTGSSELGEVFALPLPHLRTLIVHHQDNYPLDVLGDNPAMTNLVTLDCFAHALRPDDDEPYIRSEPFCRFARSPHLRSLTDLSVNVHDIGDAGVTALIESGLLRRLQTLDLWSGNISDVGARALAASGQLAGLKHLCLTENYLSDEGIALLRATGVPLDASGMYDPARLHEPEREHLWNGDME
jgi:uncharacterized protein (TIGR02996 family)